MESLILKIPLNQLRSNGHFQFHTEFYTLMEPCREMFQSIEPQYHAWCDLYDKEDAVLKKIRKSILTQDIMVADAERMRLYRGIADTNAAAQNHFSPEIVAAARRIQVVINAYGNVKRLPLDEKTSALYNLMGELTENFAEDMDTVGLTAWGKELKQRNKAVAELIRNRDDEASGRITTTMKEVRRQIDEAYRRLVVCIEAMYIMAATDEDKEWFEAFIRRLNTVIERYNIGLSHRRGAAATRTATAGNHTPAADDMLDDTMLEDGIE